MTRQLTFSFRSDMYRVTEVYSKFGDDRYSFQDNIHNISSRIPIQDRTSVGYIKISSTLRHQNPNFFDGEIRIYACDYSSWNNRSFSSKIVPNVFVDGLAWKYDNSISVDHLIGAVMRLTIDKSEGTNTDLNTRVFKELAWS